MHAARLGVRHASLIPGEDIIGQATQRKPQILPERRPAALDPATDRAIRAAFAIRLPN